MPRIQCVRRRYARDGGQQRELRASRTANRPAPGGRLALAENRGTTLGGLVVRVRRRRSGIRPRERVACADVVAHPES